MLASFSNAANSAALKSEQSFTPYGSAQYSQGSINTAKGFTGQYNDALTGLDYYGARYYDPAVGVFLSADTVQGNPQGMNPYAYVGGNPETRSDPTGHLQIDTGEGGFGADTGIGGGVDLGGWTIDAGTTEVQVGDQTLTTSPDETNITVQTTNPDGSKSWTTVEEGTPQYDQALQAIDDNYTHPEYQPKVVEQQPTVEEETTNQPSRENPNRIRFTQNSISNKGINRLTGQPYTVSENINALQNGTLSVENIDPIRIFVKTPEMNAWSPRVLRFSNGEGYLGDPQYLADGQIYSLDNRRLFAFQQAGVTDIPVVWAKLEEIEREIWKFDTQNEGTSIFVRP